MQRIRLLTGTAVAALALGAAPAFAQEASPSADTSAAAVGADEIVVTAQKRSERLQDVPMSIAAVTGDALKSAGVTNPADLAKIVPGFTAQLSYHGTPVYSMRGVGYFDTTVGGSSAVSIYVDQVPLAYSAEARGATIDLERVEVLKGPQGTLFGQNATGGAINYIAAKPKNVLEAGLSVDYSRFNRADIEGFISGPLSPTLEARLAVRTEQGGAWQKAYAPLTEPFGLPGGTKLGKRRFYNSRGTLEWTPTDALTAALTFNGWIDKSDTQAPQFLAFIPQLPKNPNNSVTYDNLGPLPRTPDKARLAGWDADVDYVHDDYFYQPSLRIDYSISDAVQITSISAYSRYRERATYEVDGTGYANAYFTRNASIESFSQELRAAGTAGSLKWMVGGNYAHDKTSEVSRNITPHGTNSYIGGLFYFTASENRNDQNVHTLAGFGSLDYAVTDQLTLQASARYTSQKRRFDGCIADPGDDGLANAFRNLFGTPNVAGGCITMTTAFKLLPIVTSHLDEDNLSWRLSANWKPSSDTLLYANLTKGYKSGSYANIAAVFEPQLNPVTQESVLAYEAGFKTRLANRAVDLSGAVFYYDYRDKQITGSVTVEPFGALNALVNVPKSRIMGAELSATVRPVNGLTMGFDATYVDTKILENPVNPQDQLGNPDDFVGDPLTNTPKWQLAFRGQYDFPISDRYEGYAKTNVSYRSAASAALGELPIFEIKGYTLVDAALGLRTSDDRWEVEVWGRNITNKTYSTGVSRLIDALTRFTGMPATYGVSVRYRM